MIPFFIPVRDRLTCLKRLVAWVASNGLDPEDIYLIDMDSTYPPMIEALKRWEDGGFQVRRQGANYGAWGLFKKGIIEREIGRDEPFFISDPDVVPDSRCRFGLLEWMVSLGGKYQDFVKIGLGLRLDDIPDHYPLKSQVLLWEKRFWSQEANDDLYYASVATTFCWIRSIDHLTPSGDNKNGTESGRTRPPNLGRHLSWYLDPRSISEDEKYYMEHAPKRTKPKVPGITWKI